MAGLYFLALALLTATAFVLSRQRAAALAGGRGREALHSLPIYHGMLVASGILAVMLLIFAFGAPLVSHLAHSNAVAQLPPDIVADNLKSTVAFREIFNIAAGQPPVRRRRMPSATPRKPIAPPTLAATGLCLPPA